MNIYDYMIYGIIISLSIYALITDIKRQEIDNWVSIVGGISILLLIILGKPIRYIISYNLLYEPINYKLALLSGILIFIIFLLIPIGGGDMKFLTFISLFFGFFETLSIFLEACIIGLIYSAITSRRYIKKNPNIFKDKTKKEIFKLSINRNIPMMIGICPAIIHYFIKMF